ncbi:hypothetical protein GCM10028805_15810 [Spirosoma harenae]
MKNIYAVALSIWLIIAHIAAAQTAPFMGTWHFENTTSGTSSNPLVGVSSVSYAGVNQLFGGYQSGYSGQGVSLQHWSTTDCNYGEYAQFSVQPQGTAHITITSLSFAFSKSGEGPQQLKVRSSVDGFSNDLYSSSVAANYQMASVGLNDGGFIDQTSAITFRIYGCNASSSNGTLRIDEIQLNGSSLPIMLRLPQKTTE